jgi:hypothetical protein
LKRDEKRVVEEQLAHKLAGFLRIACSWAPAVSRQWLQEKKQLLEQLVASKKAGLISQQQASGHISWIPHLHKMIIGFLIKRLAR